MSNYPDGVSGSNQHFLGADDRKCGDLVVDDSKMGYFRSAHRRDSEDDFELCEKCSVKVQRFIRERPREAVASE